MSRSRRQRCSRGRGCGVCGDAGAKRKKRQRAHDKAHARAGGYAAEVDEYLDNVVIAPDRSWLDYAYDVGI